MTLQTQLFTWLLAAAAAAAASSLPASTDQQQNSATFSLSVNRTLNKPLSVPRKRI